MDHISLHTDFHHYLTEALSKKSFIQVFSPAITQSPCFETHVHPLKVQSLQEANWTSYLHTSPEFFLKYILTSYAFHQSKSHGLYSLGHVFRDDPRSPIHRKQFIMLEIYELEADTNKLLTTIEEIFNYTCNKLNLPTISLTQKTMKELFQTYLNVDLSELLIGNNLYVYASNQLKLECLHYSWDDLFHYLWLNYVEPELKKFPFLAVTQYPLQLSALAKQTDEPNSLYCHRFELFMNGVEVGNGYEEEMNRSLNEASISKGLMEKKQLYSTELSQPKQFLDALEKAVIKNCSGIALGSERIFSQLTGQHPFIEWE
jgi:lysyl-tRNA synthetase class 2